jgi:hypothetical protein
MMMEEGEDLERCTVECRICGKKISSTKPSAAKFLLVQHMITHEKFLERVMKLLEEYK